MSWLDDAAKRFEPNNERQHMTDHTLEFKSDIATSPLRVPFTTFPADRISDDQSVSDRIHNAVLAERERCAKIAETYYEWHKPEYAEYCDGDPAGDISAKIRSAT